MFTVPSLLLHISEKEEQILSSIDSSQKAQGKNWVGQKGECLEPRAHHNTDDSLQNSREIHLCPSSHFLWSRS